MFNSIFELSMTDLSFSVVAQVLLWATALGAIFCAIYILTHGKMGYDRSFCTTILLMPIIIAVVIMLVSDNIARAFSLGGIFALVRFRTTITDTKDIMFICASVAAGLAAGLGYTGYGLLITCFLGLILSILHFIKFDREKESVARLKIVIPESLNYIHAFDAVFSKHLQSYQLSKVKTTDFGTTFELTYLVNMKADTNQKKFIDDLRVKNGNLNIVLTSGYVTKVSD